MHILTHTSVCVARDGKFFGCFFNKYMEVFFFYKYMEVGNFVRYVQLHVEIFVKKLSNK